MIINFNKFKMLENVENEFNDIIDYTYLNDHGTIDNIKDVCKIAEDNGYYAICVKPKFIGTVKSFIDGDIKVISMIVDNKDKFGNLIKQVQGDIIDADEIELLMDFDKLKKLSTLEGEEYDEFRDEIIGQINSISRICHKDGVIFKLIIEIDELSFDQIRLAAEICMESSVDFIQTSSGLSKKISSFEDKLEKIKYLRKILPDYMKIKASGGIRTLDQIEELKPYIDRIGTSVIIK